MGTSADIDETSMSAARVLDGLVSRHEKPLLHWMARHTPAHIVPDHLTLLGVGGAAVTALALALCHISPVFIWLAVAGLVVNWIGDSLDGTLARFRNIERPRYGFFVDHVSDIASQILIVLGLGASPFLRFDVVCLGLIAYLALAVYSFVKLHVSRTMQLTYFGVGPTETRVLIGAGLVLAATVDMPQLQTPFGILSSFDLVTLATVGFAAMSVIGMFVTDVRKLAKIDPARYGTPAEVPMTEVGSARRDGVNAAAG